VSDCCIEINGLSKVYRIWRSPEVRAKAAFLSLFGRTKFSPEDVSDFFAVNDVSFSIGRGESVGIIGLNGSGKSTLLQMLAGTLKPTRGTMRVDGRIAALLELGAGFNPDFTGRENVYLNAAILGISRNEIEERMSAVQAFADLGEFFDYPLKTYSSGMYVRLGFAVLSQVEPDVLIIDEALAVGDFLFQQKCFDTMRQFQERGSTFLFVSHSMGMVLELCSRAIVLDHGKLIFDGPAAQAVALYEETAVRQRYGAIAEASPVEGHCADRHGGTTDARPSNYDLTPNVDPKALRKEPGAIYSDEAELLFLRTLNDKFEEKQLFRVGEHITISVGFKTLKSLREPHVGFKVRDRFGRVIFETSSLCMRQNPESLGADEILVGNFKFPVRMAPEEYSIVVGFSEGSVGDRDYREALIYVQDVTSFTVVSSPSDIIWAGISHLDPEFAWSIVSAENNDAD
jgi:lipopolysaccharide transport system ATP-binding protein